jgi:hypothetical protein
MRSTGSKLNSSWPGPAFNAGQLTRPERLMSHGAPAAMAWQNVNR